MSHNLLRETLGYGLMSTPGVVIDDEVVQAGGVPSGTKIEEWLTAQTNPQVIFVRGPSVARPSRPAAWWPENGIGP